MKDKTKFKLAAAALGVVGIAAVLAQTLVPKNDSFDICSPDTQKQQRAQARGVISSLVAATASTVLNLYFTGVGMTNPATTAALLGMIMANVVGYMMDAVAIDDGYMLVKTGGRDAAKYALGRLWDASFARYAITVLLDTFITISLFNVLFPQVSTLPWFRLDTGLTQAILGSVLGIVTFFVYTNATRFLYAYPDKSTDPESWISSTQIAFATVLSGLTFLVTDAPDPSGVNSKNAKLAMLGLAMGLIAATRIYEIDSEVPDYEVSISLKRVPGSTPEPKIHVAYNEPKTMDMFIADAPRGWAVLVAVVVATMGATAYTAQTPDRKRFFMVTAGIAAAVLAPMGMVAVVEPNSKTYTEIRSESATKCAQ